jgi:cold shock CspA family protein
MRTHGTLTKWNDDRGFGFISPPNGGPDIFVHISAFPRDGVRPRVNEMISFEIESGADGKRRAVRIMRPGQRAAGRPARSREDADRGGRGIAAVLSLAAMVALVLYAYTHYREHVAVSAPESTYAESQSAPTPRPTPAPAAALVPAPAPSPAPASVPAPAYSGFSCDGRTMCSQMSSCAEAKYFIRNCPNTQMDGDSDGEPCESQWCN